MAVSAREAHPLPGIDGEVYAFKEGLGAVRLGDVNRFQHVVILIEGIYAGAVINFQLKYLLSAPAG
jgi:hypothetical protein